MSKSTTKQIKKATKVQVDPSSEWIDVTPDLANDWLENHNNLNRRLGVVIPVKYGRDMTKGKWLQTGVTIQFDWNGELIDGQNRLKAISDSGMTTRMLIVRNLDPRTRLVIDDGLRRRPHDVLRLLGWKDATHWDVAVVRTLMNGHNRKATRTEIVAAYEIHQEAVGIVTSFFPSRKIRHITISPVLAPMVRAWYLHGNNKVRRFAEVLDGGLVKNNRKGEISVILLRNHLLTTDHVTGDHFVKEIYALTETALYAFLNNEKLTKLVPTEEELFPLPETK
jgi:hypothetical protein